MKKLLTILSIAICLTASASETASNLLAKAQVVLLKTPFSLDYKANMSGDGWGGIELRGRLVYKNSQIYYFTNAGGIVIQRGDVFRASDGKNSFEGGFRHTLDWRSSKFGYKPATLDITNFITDGVMVFVAQQMAEEAEKMAKINPVQFQKLQVTIERKITDLTLLDSPQKTDENTWHLKFNVSYSTNDNSQVELWLDARTLLPVKRTFGQPDEPPLVELYSFTLNPKVSSDRFDPMQIWNNDSKMETFLKDIVKDAEKPTSRLLKAIWEGDKEQFVAALKAGADVNGTTIFVPNPVCGYTPLRLARQCGQTNFAEELIERGAK
jgi:hypothetical protein